MRGIERLAVDANPILSAIIGGSARNIFISAENTRFCTTVFNYHEVERYIPILSTKRNIPIEDLYLALSMLPLTVYDEEFYRTQMKQARVMMAKRDPHDVHLIALSLKLNCPVWSNDADFQGLEVKVYSTLDLLRG